MKHDRSIVFLKRRFAVLVAILCIVLIALIARMFYLTIFDRGFLQHQANIRILRTVKVPAYRGMILSRNQVPLAMSIPVDSIWVNPRDFPKSNKAITNVAKILSMRPQDFHRILHRNARQQFVYVKRDADPKIGQAIRALSLPGIYLERQYHRYYPEGAVTAHLIGFTNVDDKGQEGLELVYNRWLRGVPGKRQVLKDRLGQIVGVVDTVKPAQPGHPLVLSINNRIQFLAYRALKETVQKYHAKSGSVVVLKPQTGEVLAMVNQPSFDPNKPHIPPYGRYRNRAVTDMYEPGSTMKAFSIASALESGRYGPKTMINTSPGWFMVGRNEIRDELDNGVISVTQVLQKSSNVGVAKMILSLPEENLLNLLHRVGFGERTQSGFPGESPGIFPHRKKWHAFDVATLAFGYGLSVTPLQLAHAYGIIANHGMACPVTLLKRVKPVDCHRVMKTKIADAMLTMLQAVLQPGGTGTRARIAGYTVAGKTGTAYIAGVHGYNKHHHIASFIGVAPASNPQLVILVMVRDPQGRVHFGGVIAAPAFAKIMSNALRILKIPPDELMVKKIKPVRPYPEDD